MNKWSRLSLNLVLLQAEKSAIIKKLGKTKKDTAKPKISPVVQEHKYASSKAKKGATDTSKTSKNPLLVAPKLPKLATNKELRKKPTSLERKTKVVKGTAEERTNRVSCDQVLQPSDFIILSMSIINKVV